MNRTRIVSTRRAFCLAAASAPITSRVFGQTSANGPQIWRVEQQGRAYVLGFAEAKDRSWLTPSILDVFDECTDLWLETPPPGTFAPGVDPDELVREIGFEQGRTFFDALDPPVRARALAYVNELGIELKTIEPMRPWLGYITINGAFWSQAERPYTVEHPEEVLRAMAIESGKAVRHEFPTSADVLRFFASLNDKAQSQYVEMLLDYLDDEKRGVNEEYFAWASGESSDRAIERMRITTPDLYRVIQAERNAWWAAKIEELIAEVGTYFVCVGLNHVLGPDGIPRQLEWRGLLVHRE
jgi:hypothetical protein